MDADIITSAPDPRHQPPAAAPAEAPSDARAALDALARMVRARARVLRVLRRAEPAGPPWWPSLEAAIRAIAASIASASRARLLGALVERGAAGGAARPAVPTPEEAAATAHVLRVRARLSPAEQRRFDDLVRDRALEPIVSALLHRDEDEAVELLRRELCAEPQLSPASVARRVGRLRAHLTIEEYDRVIMRLPHLTDEELRALDGHLRVMDAGSAALLLRSYLAVSR